MTSALAPLTFNAASSNVSCVLCITCFIILFRYFGGDSNRMIPTKIRIFSLFGILTSMITNIWFGILVNNQATFTFISEHYIFYRKIIDIISIIDMYLLQMLLLNRIEILFRHTPKGIDSKLKLFDYYLLIISFTMITFIFITTLINACIESNNSPLFLLQNTMNLILLFVWIRKLIIFNNWLKTLNCMNIPYQIEFNKKIIARFLFFYLIFIISYYISFYLLLKYEWSFFPISIIIKIITIFLSFDIFSADYNILDIDKNNSDWNIVYNQQEVLINNEHQEQIQNYMQDILNEFYQNAV